MTNLTPLAERAALNRRRELRQFGFVFGSAIALIVGLLLPLLWKFPLSKWPWIVGAVFILAGWIVPRWLGPFHRFWMKLAEFIGGINSRIILTLCFYLIILPFGLIMRVFRADPMARRFAKAADSYRIKSKQPSPMERPF
ncbi:MAG: SxtJ family membrane protein [Methylococcaceae bacterium]|nr:SxtJ family membrane protein [Methylococcaceae bacterium]